MAIDVFRPYPKTIQALWCPFAAQKSWDTLSRDDEMIAIKQKQNIITKRTENDIKTSFVEGGIQGF